MQLRQAPAADPQPAHAFRAARPLRLTLDKGQFLGCRLPATQPLLVTFLIGADQLQFGLGNIVPGTIILDSDGEIVSRIMGEARVDDVHAPLEWLLSGKSGAPPPAIIKRY